MRCALMPQCVLPGPVPVGARRVGPVKSVLLPRYLSCPLCPWCPLCLL